MKKNFLPAFYLSCFLLLSTVSGCKKNECASEKHVFNISPVTLDWLPGQESKMALRFLSSSGDTLVFKRDTFVTTEYSKNIDTPCGDAEKHQTIEYETIFYKYSHADTLEILLSLRIETNECGWAFVDEVKLHESAWGNVSKWTQNHSKSISIGSASVQTNLINTTPEEYICNAEFGKLNATVQILGQTFYDVYTDDRPGHENSLYPLAEIFFQKGKGVIGFTDENGVQYLQIE
jgi:hypothetical protein